MRAYIDTNIFIYSMFAHPEYGLACKTVISDLEEDRIEGGISTLVPVEVLGVAIKYEPSKAKLAVAAIYSLPLKVLEISPRILYLASELALKYHLSGYDAVHVATSIEAGFEYIISNDEDIKKVKEIKLIKPMEYEEERGKRGNG